MDKGILISSESPDGLRETQKAETATADVSSTHETDGPSSEMPLMSFDGINRVTLPKCSACGKVIQDRFFMEVIGKHWHEDCLVCATCRCVLKTSLFEKHGVFICKDDYNRVFGKRCAKCLLIILTTEFVMKASNKIYHVLCFKCSFCFRRLEPGDRFKMHGAQLICERDYTDPAKYGFHKSLPYIRNPNQTLN